MPVDGEYARCWCLTKEVVAGEAPRPSLGQTPVVQANGLGSGASWITRRITGISAFGVQEGGIFDFQRLML